MADHKRAQDQPSQTLARGLLILEAFADEQSSWGIRELARRLDTNPTTVMRLVTTLQNMGYLQQDPRTQRYLLGPMAMKLGNTYAQHNPLPTIARRVFEQYADQFEYNFYLGTLRRYQVIYLAVLDGRGPIKVVVEPGAFVGLHTTALGKVLLAFQSDEYIEEFLQSGYFVPCTDQSITDPDQLRQQMQEIRQSGFAVNNGEHFEGVAAVGAPLFNAQGDVVAGISLAYPLHLSATQRIQTTELARLAREIAQHITHTAGYLLEKA